MDPWSIAGNTLGAGSLSPKSDAKSGATGGFFQGGTSGAMFGDFNVQFGGIGGATGGFSTLQLVALALGGFLVWRWARKA